MAQEGTTHWTLLRGEDGTPLCEVDIARRLVRVKKRRRDGSEGTFLIDVLEVFFYGMDGETDIIDSAATGEASGRTP